MFVEKSRIIVTAVGHLVMAALAILLAPASAEAATVVIDEAGMNGLFSQENFGDTPISIRFNPSRQIVAPGLLVIDTAAKLQALYSLATDPAPTVTAFFVDDLDVCVGVEVAVNGEFSGCAQLPGRIMVEDFHKAELTPAILMAHELGHNANLEHNRFDGLMSLFPPHGTELFDYEVATILQSPIVQTDSTGQRFIQITPIAIVDTPEPSTPLLLSGGLGALLIIKTNRWLRIHVISG